MALAARTIRIEAPIPGKTVVGIEIPNMDFNVVAIRRILGGSRGGRDRHRASPSRSGATWPATRGPPTSRRCPTS